MLRDESTNILEFTRDVRSDVGDVLLTESVLSWDIETSGLDWRTKQIGTCQIFAPKSNIVVIVNKIDQPDNLSLLLENARIKKIFHHAMFDLRFLRKEWGTQAKNIACTKIAAKLLQVPRRESGLKSLLHLFLDIDIEKATRLQKSEWTRRRLTKNQLKYAASDVIYLPSLFEVMSQELRKRGLADLANKCYRHLPVRTELEVRGYPDVYRY